MVTCEFDSLIVTTDILSFLSLNGFPRAAATADLGRPACPGLGCVDGENTLHRYCRYCRYCELIWDVGTKTSLSSSSGHRMTHFHLNQRTAKSPASAERCDVSRLDWAGPGSNILSQHEQHKLLCKHCARPASIIIQHDADS